MGKDSNIMIRIDSILKDNFKEICSKEGFTISEVILACVKDIEKRGRIPLRLYSILNVKKAKTRITIPLIKKLIQEIVDNNFSDKIEKVYLFGSYARGEETFESDIDLKIVTKPGFTLLDLSNFEESVKQQTLKEVDVVLSTGMDSRFSEIIKKDEICIYGW